jgi:hypothetical protein
MKFLKRLAPWVVIAAAALLLLYIPDVGPERYTDLATFFRVERGRQAFSGYAVAAVSDGAVIYLDAFGTDASNSRLAIDSPLLLGGSSAVFAGFAALGQVRDQLLDPALPALRDLAGKPVLGLSAGAGWPDASGFSSLALAMEAAEDKPFADILYERLFKPLEMKRSGARLESLGAGLPQGSGCFFGASLPRPRPLFVTGASSGLAYSTAADLGVFLSFLAAPEKFKKQPLSPKTVRLLFEPLSKEFRGGYGWFAEGEGAERSSHSAGFSGDYASRLVIWPARKAAIAIIAPQDSYFQAALALPALADGARRIMAEGSAERPFPLARLYYLLAVMACVHLVVLAGQTQGALRWAKDVRGRYEAKGSRGPLHFALVRSWTGIALRCLAAIFVPAILGFFLGGKVAWKSAFALEPGLSAWLASALFFGFLRNAARLAWLRGAPPLPRRR